MSRGTQLIQLLSMLRAEAGQSMKVSVGVDAEGGFKHLLARTQESLYDDYDWPFMRVLPTKALSAGQRYYDLPADLNMERIESVVVWDSGSPCPLTRGIDWPDYAQHNSDGGERADPALKWDIRHTGTKEQIEIWPVPASNDMTLQFKGIKKLNPLIANDDTAELDDLMITLFAASEILARQKSEDAGAKLAAAKDRRAIMRGRTKGGSATVVMNGGEQQSQRGRTVIRVS